MLRERAIVWAYGLALLAFGAIGTAVYLHLGTLGVQSRWVEHTHRVLTTLERTLGELRDIETGERGYLLSGEDEFLQPYRASVTKVRENVAELETLTADNLAQQRRLDALGPVVDHKLAFAAKTIDLFRAGDRDEARALVASGEGKELMDEIRRRVAEIDVEERRLLDERLARAEATAWRTTALLVFGNAFGFTLLAAGTILLGRELNHRKRLEQEISFRDERAALEELARGAQRNLQTVVDEMPTAIVLVEAGSRAILLSNHRMDALYGGVLRSDTRHETLDALELRTVDGVPVAAKDHPLTRVIASGAVVHGEELQLVRADGSVVHVLVDAAPTRAPNGRVTGAIGVLRERDEVRRNDDERRRAAQFRDLFLGALGHELRNPLTVMTAGASALARRVSSPSEAKIVARMSSSADRMGRMIDQLLDFTQARLGGSIALDVQRADLGAIAQSVLERLDVVYPERTFQLTTDGEVSGAWDPGRIAQVIEQLAVNAIEHGRGDAPIRVTVRSLDGDVSVEVENQGAPIPGELRPFIFDPFRRAAERRRMKSVGLGLGLYLVAQIVHAHRGRIEVDSKDGATVFRVELPRSGG